MLISYVERPEILNYCCSSMSQKDGEGLSCFVQLKTESDILLIVAYQTGQRKPGASSEDDHRRRLVRLEEKDRAQSSHEERTEPSGEDQQ